MSQQTVPLNVPVTYELTAAALMTDWLADRVQQVIIVLARAAIEHNVQLNQIVVTGFESHEEPTRELVVTALIDAPTDAQALEFWDSVEDMVHDPNETPPPTQANGDIRLASQVFWNE